MADVQLEPCRLLLAYAECEEALATSFEWRDVLKSHGWKLMKDDDWQESAADFVAKLRREAIAAWNRREKREGATHG